LWVALLVGAAGVGAPACGSSHPGDTSCPRPQPAFRVVITAANGPLPADTVLTVKSGSGIESYALASPPEQPKTVFCNPFNGDAGDAAADAGSPDASSAAHDGAADPGSIAALLCLLWTNGAADVTIQGSGYPTLTETLDAEQDSCGITTVDESLTLGEAPDGGSN
jgi:hypothetical protein